MTDEELDVIEERAAKATPGPWVATETDGRRNSGIDSVSMAELEGLGGRKVATVWDRGGKANRFFIAAAREDVPALVAEVRRLRAAIAKATGTAGEE